jgi:hypothetical protein
MSGVVNRPRMEHEYSNWRVHSFTLAPHCVRCSAGVRGQNSWMVSPRMESKPALSLPKGSMTMRAFYESLSLLARLEDPDFDYPPGHTIPFSMAIAEIEMQDSYFLRLERLTCPGFFMRR